MTSPGRADEDLVHHFGGFAAAVQFDDLPVEAIEAAKKSILDTVGVILAALLFAVLQHGGIYVDGFSEHVTKDIVQVLQGIIILFVAAESFFKYMSGKLRIKNPGKV